MKTLILLRGVPGSGKSTLAKSLGGVHIEADQYFMKEGTYKFDVTKLKDAHEWCQRECEKAMIFEVDVVVSNTFTQYWEMEVYFELAKQYSYQVHSLIVENRHGNQSIHSVPPETIEKMKNRFEIKL